MTALPRSKTVLHWIKSTRKNGATFDHANSWYTTKWTNSVSYGPNWADWKRRLREGSDATTSMTGTKSEIAYKSGLSIISRPKDPLISTSFWKAEIIGSHDLSIELPTADPSTVSATSANRDALMKFVKRVKQVNTALEGMVLAGEAAQTLRGILHPAQGLRKLVDATRLRMRNFLGRFRRSNLQRNVVPDQALEGLSEMWLEQSFHWTPLLNDIDGGARALAELSTGQNVLSHSVNAKGESFANSSETTSVHNVSLAKWQKRTISQEHVIVIFRGAVRARAANPATLRQELLGFQPRNFVPSAWELLPYSFLIDYFTNIGDILAGWSVQHSDLSWCNRTIIRALEETRVARTWLSLVQSSWPDVDSVSSLPSQVVVSKRHVSRASYVGTFVPTFDFEIPGLGSKRWLNIAALIGARASDRSWWFGS